MSAFKSEGISDFFFNFHNVLFLFFFYYLTDGLGLGLTSIQGCHARWYIDLSQCMHYLGLMAMGFYLAMWGLYPFTDSINCLLANIHGLRPLDVR